MEGVNKLQSCTFPSLHDRKEGWPSDQEDIGEQSADCGAGGFFGLKTEGDPPGLRQFGWLRDIFLMTHPPLFALMQGGKKRPSVISSRLRPPLQLLPKQRRKHASSPCIRVIHLTHTRAGSSTDRQIQD